MSQLAPELAPARHTQTATQRLSALVARPIPALDLWFGILLPVLCFALDPGFVNGSIPTFLMPQFPLAALALCAVSMLALLLWHVGGRNLPGIAAILAGVLSAGGVVALLVGFSLLPYSLLGIFIGIGVLGFVPFLTAFVYGRAAALSLAEESARATWWNDWLAIASAVLVIGCAVGYQRGADRLIDLSVAEIAGDDPRIAAAAVQRMRQWRVVLPSRELVRLAREINALSPGKLAHYRAAYQSITGEPLTDRMLGWSGGGGGWD